METFNYVTMADLLQQLPGLTEELILGLVAENRIPQPIDPSSEKGIIEKSELLFPPVTRDIIREAAHLFLYVQQGGWEFDFEDLVSIAVNNDVLPFFNRLWVELYDYGEFSTVIDETTNMLEGLYRPVVFKDFEAQTAAQYRRYRRHSIAHNVMNPAVLNSATRDELEEAIEPSGSTGQLMGTRIDE